MNPKISRLWNVQTIDVPIIIEKLGTITDRVTSFLTMVRVSLSFETIRKSALLGSANIFEKDSRDPGLIQRWKRWI